MKVSFSLFILIIFFACTDLTINETYSVKIAKILRQNKSRSVLTNTIIKEGLENAKQFSWNECYKLTKQVYKEVYASNI